MLFYPFIHLVKLVDLVEVVYDPRLNLTPDKELAHAFYQDDASIKASPKGIAREQLKMYQAQSAALYTVRSELKALLHRTVSKMNLLKPKVRFIIRFFANDPKHVLSCSLNEFGHPEFGGGTLETLVLRLTHHTILGMRCFDRI